MGVEHDFFRHERAFFDDGDIVLVVNGRRRDASDKKSVVGKSLYGKGQGVFGRRQYRHLKIFLGFFDDGLAFLFPHALFPVGQENDSLRVNGRDSFDKYGRFVHDDCGGDFIGVAEVQIRKNPECFSVGSLYGRAEGKFDKVFSRNVGLAFYA